MQRFRSYLPVGVLLPLFVLALAVVGAATVSTASSDAFALEIAPCEVLPDSDFAAGVILVKMEPGADIGLILEEEGEPPDAAVLHIERLRWYIVSVPEGEELAKCRAYSMHPEVLFAEPGFFGSVGDPVPAADVLPSGGGVPDASRVQNSHYMMAIGGALAVLGTLILMGASVPAISTRPDDSRGGK